MDNDNIAFDVIVAGAGTGGTIAAYFAAKNGLNVCLIDKKPETLEPAKICGDALGNEIFDILGIAHPAEEELSCHIKGIKLYSPDREKCYVIVDPKITGYMIDRLKFSQRLLKDAIGAGVVRFLPNTKVLDVVTDGGTVVGVKTKSDRGEEMTIHAKIVIDASGLHSPLRKKIKSELIENDLSNDDAALCYREIVTFPTKAQKIKDPDYLTIIMDQSKAPGGYVWYFPKNECTLNIGMGGHMDYGARVKELYKSEVFSVFVNTDEVEVLSSAGGVVSLRRPLWSCADNGIMFVGDAAFHVVPLHGGGIETSMRAGYHAAMTAVKAVENKDYSLNTLWEYNVRIMKGFGSECAGLDLFRKAVQSFSNNDLNFVLKKNLVTVSELLDMSKRGSFYLSFGKMMVRALRGISRFRLLLKLNYLRTRMARVVTLYRNFPESNDIEQFKSWKSKVQQEIDSTSRLFSVNRYGN